MTSFRGPQAPSQQPGRRSRHLVQLHEDGDRNPILRNTSSRAHLAFSDHVPVAHDRDCRARRQGGSYSIAPAEWYAVPRRSKRARADQTLDPADDGDDLLQPAGTPVPNNSRALDDPRATTLAAERHLSQVERVQLCRVAAATAVRPRTASRQRATHGFRGGTGTLPGDFGRMTNFQQR